MSTPKVRTTPDISIDSPAHQKAIADGKDSHLWMWQRNVIDKFKSLPDEEIKKELQRTAFPYAVAFENWAHDFNISSGIRNANAFNAQCVYYIGDKKFDRRGAQGVHNYTDVNFVPTIDKFLELKKQYTFIGIDNVPGAIPLTEHSWVSDSILIFGSEGVGLTPAMQKMCDKIVYIPQYGSVRSINAATASGIIMNDFVSRFNG